MRILITVSVLFIFITMGCSSNKYPTAPTNDVKSDQNGEAQVSVGRTGDTGSAPFGVYEGFIDPKTLTVELKPSRNAAKIGDIFDADITQFLMFQPCWNCARIDGITVDPSGDLSIHLAIKHPVPNINARPDLHVFDVRGIMILPSDTSFDLQYPMPGGSGMGDVSGNARLVTNADGYTTHFDEIAADTHYFNPPMDIPGTLNPYRRFFTNTDTPVFDPHNPVGYNVFPAGSGWESQVYNLDTSGQTGPITFVYILDASYGQSAVLKNRQSPQYYLPAFNRKEPWRVDVSVTGNTLVAGSNAATASATIHIEVYDWQGARTIDQAYPDPSHLTGIPYTSNVTGAYLSVPGIFDGMLQSTTPTGGSGAVGDPYKYDIEFTNEKGANVGKYFGLVSIRDELWDQEGPLGIPASPAGFPYPGLDIRDYSSYRAFPISITDPWSLHPNPFPGDYNLYYGRSSATGNFNNDAYADLAVGAYGVDPYGTVYVFFGNGAGFDDPPVALNSSVSLYDQLGMNVAVGKMNDDEYDDVVTVGLNGTIAIFLSNGTGGFEPPILYKDPVQMNSYFGSQLRIGNMNSDNYGDIVVSDYAATVGAVTTAGKVYVHFFDGSSILAPTEIAQAVPGSSHRFGFAVGIAKINQDAIDDLLVNWDSEIYPGEYGEVEMIISDGFGGVSFRDYMRTRFPHLNSIEFGSTITTVDLNKDNIKEWIIGAEFNNVGAFNSAGEFFIFYPDGDYGFRGYTRIANGDPQAYDRLAGNSNVSTGDINGDGALDLIVPAPNYSSTSGKVELYLATPIGYQYYRTYTEPPSVSFSRAFSCSVLGMNVDSNPDDELLVGSGSENHQGRLYVYFNP